MPPAAKDKNRQQADLQPGAGASSTRSASPDNDRESRTLCESDHLELSHWSKYWPYLPMPHESTQGTVDNEVAAFLSKSRTAGLPWKRSMCVASSMPTPSLGADSLLIVFDGTISSSYHRHKFRSLDQLCARCKLQRIPMSLWSGIVAHLRVLIWGVVSHGSSHHAGWRDEPCGFGSRWSWKGWALVGSSSALPVALPHTCDGGRAYIVWTLRGKPVASS